MNGMKSTKLFQGSFQFWPSLSSREAIPYDLLMQRFVCPTGILISAKSSAQLCPQHTEHQPPLCHATLQRSNSLTLIHTSKPNRQHSVGRLTSAASAAVSLAGSDSWQNFRSPKATSAKLIVPSASLSQSSKRRCSRLSASVSYT